MTEETLSNQIEAPKDSPDKSAAAVTEEANTDTTNNEVQKQTPIVSSSKQKRPVYKYDPNKITLRFLFANRDGLAVTIQCDPADTVGEVKGALISVWPKGKKKNRVCLFVFYYTFGCIRLNFFFEKFYLSRCTSVRCRGTRTPRLHGKRLFNSRHPHTGGL